MTWLPSAQCACGQPWEAHELRCPRPKQRVGRVIALAVAGGAVLQVLFIVALFFAAELMSPPIRIGGIRVVPIAGPIQPRVHACELFYAWKRTHNPSLLNQAVADAYSSRIPRTFAPRFRTDLSGLRDSTRKSAHSPTTGSFEHAVRHDCSQVTHGLSWRDWPRFRKAVADLSQPGTPTGRTADFARPGAPGPIRSEG